MLVSLTLPQYDWTLFHLGVLSYAFILTYLLGTIDIVNYLSCDLSLRCGNIVGQTTVFSHHRRRLQSSTRCSIWQSHL